MLSYQQLRKYQPRGGNFAFQAELWPHSWHYLINLVRFVTVFTITLVGQADWYEIGNTGYIGQTCQQNIVLLTLKNLSPAPILEKYLLDQNFQTKNFRTFIFAVRDCKGSCVTFIQLPISAKQPEAPAEAELSYISASAPHPPPPTHTTPPTLGSD